LAKLEIACVTDQNVISEWHDLQTLHEALKAESGRQWLFRGQRDFRSDLASSLERAVHRRFGQPLTRVPDYEKWLVIEFKRHAHRYAQDLPSDDDKFRWLALMQHHGAPTRLLDFTYSFFVGLYFAVECATPGEHCALWAVDADWCWRRATDALEPGLVKRIKADTARGKTPELQAEVLESQECVVVPDNSFFLDERIAVQQGVFLVPLDLTTTFMNNLDATAGEAEGHVHRYEICCSVEFMKTALLELRRMNISRVSLFPGLDGFAASLRLRILITDLSQVLGVAEHAV
jgi:hypothetical protein